MSRTEFVSAIGLEVEILDVTCKGKACWKPTYEAVMRLLKLWDFNTDEPLTVEEYAIVSDTDLTLGERAALLPRFNEGILKDVMSRFNLVTPRPEARSPQEVAKYRKAASTKIGRPLADGECVHHINMDETDHRPENLFVCEGAAEHLKIHWSMNALVPALMERGIVYFDKDAKVYKMRGEING